MAILAKLSALFWFLVWYVFPFVGPFLLLAAYGATLGFGTIPDVTYADLEVLPPIGHQAKPINVRVQYSPLIPFLPWNSSEEEKEYVRCERVGEIWWVEVATKKRITRAASLERVYQHYCHQRDAGKRKRDEAEMIKAILEQAK